MQQPPDDDSETQMERLRDVGVPELRQGVKTVEGISPEEEEAHNRRSNLYLKNTIRKVKQIAVWIALAAFGLLIAALLGIAGFLMWVHVRNISTDADKVEQLLGSSITWLMVAATSLFIDRRLRGD